MGTINYKTSDYITIGYNLNNIDYDDEFYNDIITDYYDQIKYRLEKERFYYFHVKLDPGYYEGFALNIEFNFKYCFDDCNDKRAAQREITRLKAFLLECINDYECCSIWPGWCTTYHDYKTSVKHINAAISEMRAEVRTTPTWARLPAGEKYAC